jgi:hypothetical protein
LEKPLEMLAFNVDTHSAEKFLLSKHYDPFDPSQLEGVLEKTLEDRGFEKLD